MATNSRERSPWSDAVGDTVRAERARIRLSQAQLAKLSGVSRSTLLRIEAGTHVADATQLGRLCQVFDMPLSEFFRRVEAELAPEPASDDDTVRGA